MTIEIGCALGLAATAAGALVMIWFALRDVARHLADIARNTATISREMHRHGDTASAINTTGVHLSAIRHEIECLRADHRPSR